MDHSLPGSSVHGILQVGILDWVAMALLQGNFLTQGLTLGLMSSALAGVFFTTSATWELWYWPKKKKILIFLTFYFLEMDIENLIWLLIFFPPLIISDFTLYFSRPCFRYIQNYD